MGTGAGGVSSTARAGAPKSQPKFGGNPLRALKNPAVVVICIAILVLHAFGSGIYSNMRIIENNLGFSAAMLGLSLNVKSFMGIIGRPIFGRVADAIEPKLVLVAVLVISVVGVGAFAFADTELQFVIILVIIWLGAACLYQMM